MQTKSKKLLRDIAITLIILCLTFGISVVLQEILSIGEHITTVFVFAVFIISLCTEGYFFGIFSAFVSMIAINFAFTFPYLALNFSIPENFVSALVMITISILTSALITRLKKWQAIRVEAEKEKMRANLLRAVSHDLRTPLTTVYGSSSAILEEYDSFTDEQKKKMISGIKEDTEWLMRMVENLLSITRIDSENVKVIKSPTVLEELVDSVILKFKKRYPSQTVNICLPDELVIIPMDPMLIEQVVVNILENAVQHAVGMTRLDFRVFLESGNAVFEIADDGCGIEKDRLDKIFTGYYDGRQKPLDGGRHNAGIGLSVCDTIIRAHGGTICAENAVQGGAVFRFSLNTEEIVDD